MTNVSRKILFLDRDGVINKKAPEHEYITHVRDFTFNNGIFALLKKHIAQGFEIIIITNQRGIARGKLTEVDLAAIHQHMIGVFAQEGIVLLDLFYCPHMGDDCSCRKPKPGMLEAATKKYDINLAESVLISDSVSEIEMGKAFGVGSNILVPVDAPGLLL